MALSRYDYNLSPRQHLNEEDECYYFMEHTNGGYEASPSNNKISNFKKSVSVKTTGQWKWKKKAIKSFIGDLTSLGINPSNIVIVVPGATSDPRLSSDFDDRIDQVAQGFADSDEKFRVEHLIEAVASVTPSSHGGSRSKSDIIANTKWNGFTGDIAETVIIIDDVLTTGAHYKAWKEVIQANAPEVKRVIGFFWALHV